MCGVVEVCVWCGGSVCVVWWKCMFVWGGRWGWVQLVVKSLQHSEGDLQLFFVITSIKLVLKINRTASIAH